MECLWLRGRRVLEGETRDKMCSCDKIPIVKKKL